MDEFDFRPYYVKVSLNGKGRGQRPERPLIILNILTRYLKRNSSRPPKAAARKFESTYKIGRVYDLRCKNVIAHFN